MRRRSERFTYYRLQPEVIHLQAGSEPLGCDGDDRFVFADGVVVSIIDGKLQGVSQGTTYVQKYVETYFLCKKSWSSKEFCIFPL